MYVQNLRKNKILGIAIFDLTVSAIALILLFLLAWRVHFHKLHWYTFVLAGLILTIPLGIIIHVFFGANTMLNYKLGLSNYPKITN
jgi:ABC-type Fe3+-siderophore transport system permease subunit